MESYQDLSAGAAPGGRTVILGGVRRESCPAASGGSRPARRHHLATGVGVSKVKIVSGGQTGVDRGALDAAIALGIPHGGWCPRGRLAEDGRISDRYNLRETESADYPVRTERNVIDIRQ